MIRRNRLLLAPCGLLASAVFWLVSSAPAQTTATPAPQDEHVVQLSPFVVTTKEADGYATTSSTSASRIAVPITDLSTSVIGINERLIMDTVAVNAEDVLNLVGGVSAFAETQSQEQNKFSMRGYTTSSAQRDGFTDYLYGQNGGFNYVFIERMEVLKGPNGVLYGSNGPGGLLNLVSKRPLEKPRTRISLMGGSYDFYRADLDTSNWLGKDKQFGYRLSASYSNNSGALDHPADVNKSKGFFAINPVLTYRTSSGFETWFWSGFVRDKSPRLKRITKGFRTSPTTGAFLEEIPEGGGAHNVLTNGAGVTNDSYEIGASKGVNLGSNLRLDMRVLARDIDLLNTSTLVNATGGIDVYVDKAGNIIGQDGRTIDYDKVVNNIGGIYRSVAVQLTGSNNSTRARTYATDFAFNFDAGPTKNNLLLFATYDTVDLNNVPGFNGRTYQVSGVANLAKIGADVAGNVARIWLYPLDRETMAGISPQTVIDNANVISTQNTTIQNNEQYSFGAMERMSLLQERLFLVAGTRYTDLQTLNKVGIAPAQETTDGVWSTTLGAVAKAYKGRFGQAAVFLNDNETFVPVFTIDRRLATFGEKFPNRTIAIREAGVKLDLFDTRLSLTGSVYKTHEDNVLVSNVDVDGSVTGISGSTYQSPAGEANTKGWDIDAALNITKGFNVVVSYGQMDSRLSDGRHPPGQPDNTFSTLARYEIQSGAFKNLSLAWNYTWWGESSLNNRTYWQVESGDLHTAIVGYKWGRIAARLRIENVFDTFSVRPSVNETAAGLTNHRNYRLQVDYTF